MSKPNHYDDEILSEKSFYPPSDDRILKSLISDVDDENNFVKYAKYIFDLYEEEDMYEN